MQEQDPSSQPSLLRLDAGPFIVWAIRFFVALTVLQLFLLFLGEMQDGARWSSLYRVCGMAIFLAGLQYSRYRWRKLVAQSSGCACGHCEDETALAAEGEIAEIEIISLERQKALELQCERHPGLAVRSLGRCIGCWIESVDENLDVLGNAAIDAAQSPEQAQSPG